MIWKEATWTFEKGGVALWLIGLPNFLPSLATGMVATPASVSRAMRVELHPASGFLPSVVIGLLDSQGAQAVVTRWGERGLPPNAVRLRSVNVGTRRQSCGRSRERRRIACAQIQARPRPMGRASQGLAGTQVIPTRPRSPGGGQVHGVMQHAVDNEPFGLGPMDEEMTGRRTTPVPWAARSRLG